MKKFVLISLIAASLAVSAKALIIGAGVGYLVDGEEAYATLRVGHQFKTATSVAHIGEIEVGYTSESEAGVSAKFMPVTLNYRAELSPNAAVSYHVGFGAGSARTQVKSWLGSTDDWSFAAQGFAGVGFHPTKAVTINLGARYIWIDDVSIYGTEVEVGDDVSLELGVSIKF